MSAILAVVLYAITLAGGYVYDDRFIVLNDPRVHQPRQWVRLWTNDYFDGGVDNLYRPIVSSSYALEWWVHGDRPWIFHGINVVLHALTAAGVAEFTRRALCLFAVYSSPFSRVPEGRYSGPRGNAGDEEKQGLPDPTNTALPCGARPNMNAPALIAGLLFAAHPIHVEAVANIVGRAELACTACIFAALILLCRQPLTQLRVFGAVAIAAIGLLCKEQGIVQPLLWLFLGFLLREKNGDTSPLKNPPNRSAILTLILITVWSWAIYLLVREHLLKFEWDSSNLDPTVQPLILSAGLNRLLMPVVLLGHYTALLLWPAHPSLDYGADAIGHIARASDPYLWIGFLAIAIWIIAAIRCAIVRTPAHRFVLFCLLGLAVSYGIVGNVIMLIGTIFAERLMYLPSAFFLMIVAVVSCNLPVRIRTITVCSILILASIRTVTAARLWNHPLELYEASRAAQPKSIQVYLLLAEDYHNQHDYTDAAAALKKVCDLYPDYWRVWKYRCEEALADGDITDADQYLKRALPLDHNPTLADLAGRLGKAKAATKP